MLKAAGKKMIFLVYKLIQQIARTCNVPKEMKQSTLIMIHKKGSKLNPMNYRPTSLLQSTYKILDSWCMLVVNEYIKQISGHQLEQYGFIQKKSCL